MRVGFADIFCGLVATGMLVIMISMVLIPCYALYKRLNWSHTITLKESEWRCARMEQSRCVAYLKEGWK